MAQSDRFIHLRGDSAPRIDQPPRCPKCNAVETSSAAKRPTRDSYWRCLKCGDVWSPALLSNAAPRRR